MKSCFKFLVICFTIVLSQGCSNEIDVLASYEESASIYALLDPNLSTQFVKINKVFVNPNARTSDVAKIADSLYFDSIAPEIVELGTGRRIALFKANVLLKDSGYFVNSPNYLYVTKERIYSNQQYSIEVKLPKTGKVISASTNIANTPFLMQPVSAFQNVINIPEAGSLVIQFQSAKNTKIFDSYFTFHYIEIDKADTNIKTPKSIRWKILRSYRTQRDDGKEIVIQRTQGAAFYDLLLSEIPVNPNVFRRFDLCEIEMVAGNLELDTYIQASTPSIGIVQKQTDYTNINNGIGVFASRNTLYFNTVSLSEITKLALTQNVKYQALNFTKN